MIHDLKEIEMRKIYKNKTVRQATCSVKVRKKLLKLVGEKPVLQCRLEGKEVDMLWDTGSMISVVDRKWLKRIFPGAIIHSVSQFTDKELHVQAANSTKIRFDGVVVFGFGLGELEESFAVPVLVSSDEMSEPILGYNVIEHLIVNGTKAEREALKEAFRVDVDGEPVDMDPLAATIQERAESDDFITEVKAPNQTCSRI